MTTKPPHTNASKGRQAAGSDKPTKAEGGHGKATGAGAQRPARRKAKKPPQITPDTYNRLQEAYFASQTILGAAKAAGVARGTARYYIEGPGRPDHGMTPIKQLWLDVQTEVQEKRQLTLVKFHEEQTKELEEILGTVAAEMKLIRAEVFRRVKRFRESGGQDIEIGMSLGKALNSYEKASRLMERFLGAPDATLEHRGEEMFKNWTDEEITEFMVTGKVPDHAR